MLFLQKTKQDKKNIKTPFKKKAGFTLIETLVAITVLTVAVAAPLTLAAQSLLAAFNARDQVTAFHLAQDAIETVRAKRDNNLARIIANQNTYWLDGLEGFIQKTKETSAQKPFMVDSINGRFISCDSTSGTSCDPLSFNPETGYYSYNINDKQSRFTRFVNIVEVPGTDGDEVQVRSEVRWRSGSRGKYRSVVIETNLFYYFAGIFKNI